MMPTGPLPGGMMAQVRDPVCNMTIDSAGAVGSSRFDGTTYYFCSLQCKETFDADPAKFAGAMAPGGEPPFTTTGPLTAPKFGAAGSGGAEDEPGPEGGRHT
jgi:YHS domain-containing protein